MPKDIEGQPQIPGFVIKKDDKGRTVYGPDEKYWNAQLAFREMPVAPEYDVIRGVVLKGAPHVTSQRNTASNPRNTDLPTVPELKGRQVAQVEAEVVRSQLETTAYASNVFIFPVIMVDSTFAEQPIAEQAGKTTVEDSVPLAVSDGKIMLNRAMEGDIEGLAYVAHVRKPVDLRDYFRKARDMDGFTGEVSTLRNASEGRLPNEIFNEIFRERLERIGTQVSELRGTPVKGILLSTVKLNYRIADRILDMGFDPRGEMIMAASYLV